MDELIVDKLIYPSGTGETAELGMTLRELYIGQIAAGFAANGYLPTLKHAQMVIKFADLLLQAQKYPLPEPEPES